MRMPGLFISSELHTDAWNGIDWRNKRIMYGVSDTLNNTREYYVTAKIPRSATQTIVEMANGAKELHI